MYLLSIVYSKNNWFQMFQNGTSQDCCEWSEDVDRHRRVQEWNLTMSSDWGSGSATVVDDIFHRTGLVSQVRWHHQMFLFASRASRVGESPNLLVIYC